MPHNPNWLGLFTGTLHQIYHMHLVNQEHHHLHQGLRNCICISSSTKYHYPSHRAQFWFLERKVLLLLYWSLAILLFRLSIMYNQEEGKEEEFKRWRKRGFEDSGICASTLKQQSAKTIDCNRKPDSQACECRTNGHHYPGHYHYRQGYSDRIALIIPAYDIAVGNIALLVKPVVVVCIILATFGCFRLYFGSQKTSVLLGCILVVFGCIRLLLVVFWLSYYILYVCITYYTLGLRILQNMLQPVLPRGHQGVRAMHKSHLFHYFHKLTLLT